MKSFIHVARSKDGKQRIPFMKDYNGLSIISKLILKQNIHINLIMIEFHLKKLNPVLNQNVHLDLIKFHLDLTMIKFYL